MSLDLNCDLGEGGLFDADLMALATSANIACGFHAGGPTEAYNALGLAKTYDVQVGAHPGFPDREGFGRRELIRTEDEVHQDCLYQIGALIGLAKAHDVRVRYVKPHGALYNLAAREMKYAEPIVRATEVFGLALVGLPDSMLEEASLARCPFIAEGFADRRYTEDGTLVPRSHPEAMIRDPEDAVRQVDRLLDIGRVRTICIHGDNPHAVDFARKLREVLTEQGIALRPFSTT